MPHTKGPLTAGLDMPAAANNNPDPRLIWSGSMCIGSAVSNWIPLAEQEANARLWASAPDLLEQRHQLREALEHVLVAIDEYVRTDNLQLLADYLNHEYLRSVAAKTGGLRG